MTACDICLRRGFLIGFVAPRVSAFLGRPEHEQTALFALNDEALIRALCRDRDAASSARTFMDRFDPVAARSALEAARTCAVCRHDAAFPARLTELDDAPAVLFLAGAPERLQALASGPCVTVVGTRRPSSYGLDMAAGLGRALAQSGVTVISGLALGIDAAAHLGACDADETRALAVIARGPERPYPQRHAPLYRRIRRAGCVISELPPGTGVFRWAFPARNRIMAALADLTVVVEAADPSGSLITAAFALDLHREVGAVPGRATATCARGPNNLIRDGAHVILGADDVLGLLTDIGRPPEPGEAQDPAADLEPALAAVLAAVEGSDRHDDISEATGLKPGPLRAALGRLEFLGLVRPDGLGGYIRATP